MRNGKHSPTVGIIAEDISDVLAVRVLIHRISQNTTIGTKRFVGKGCGKINRKCHAWATNLRDRGCSVLIVIHDLDTHLVAELYRKIESALDPCPIATHLICIPVRELEAWFLSDPVAIQRAMKLRKPPKMKGLPESFAAPKEHLAEIVYRASAGEKIYVNTDHNEIIANFLSIQKAAKCKSFLPFRSFVTKTCTATA